MVDHLVNSEANKQRIQRIESSFGSAGIPLFRSGRVLLGEGVLTKICKKKPKTRQFFLFNDILIYGNVVIGNKKFKQYNKQRIIPLEEVKLNNIEDDGVLQNGWCICSKSKSFAVYATTPIEKQQWMDHITRAVQEHVREGMHCKKTQFTFVNRRHHCRKCGLVVCGNCSSQRAVIPEQNDKPQRVCAACAVELKRDGDQRRNLSAAGDSFTNSTESPAGSDEESYSPNEAFIDPSERANFYDNTNNGDKTEDHGQLV